MSECCQNVDGFVTLKGTVEHQVIQLHKLKINEIFTVPTSVAAPIIMLKVRMEVGKSPMPLMYQRCNSEKHLYLLHVCHTCMPKGNMGKKY